MYGFGYTPLINSMRKGASAPSYPASLKLFIDAGNPLSYSGTGTVATDLTGNGNNATLVNGTSYNSANGGTFVFDGVNDYIDTNTKAFINEMTVESWIKLPTITAGQQYILVDSGQGYTEYKLSAGKLSYNLAGSSGVVGSTTLNINTYYHLVATFKAGELAKVYVNGVVDGTSSGNFSAIQNNSANLRLMGNGPFYLQGNVGMLKIYNAKRTDAEVLASFNEFKSRYGY